MKIWKKKVERQKKESAFGRFGGRHETPEARDYLSIIPHFTYSHARVACPRLDNELLEARGCARGFSLEVRRLKKLHDCIHMFKRDFKVPQFRNQCRSSPTVASFCGSHPIDDAL